MKTKDTDNARIERIIEKVALDNAIYIATEFKRK